MQGPAVFMDGSTEEQVDNFKSNNFNTINLTRIINKTRLFFLT